MFGCIPHVKYIQCVFKGFPKLKEIVRYLCEVLLLLSQRFFVVDHFLLNVEEILPSFSVEPTDFSPSRLVARVTVAVSQFKAVKKSPESEGWEGEGVENQRLYTNIQILTVSSEDSEVEVWQKESLFCIIISHLLLIFYNQL